MCIRDRSQRGNRAAAPGSAGSSSAPTPGEPATAPAQAWPCLLYTSDAADERSSVDLGGRRIIKKKKHDVVSELDDVNSKHTTTK